MLLKGPLKGPASESEGNPGRIWYIHITGCIPTKKQLRVVFDCAATYQGNSLNSQLLQGPNLNNSLIGVLMRFRDKPIALAADVEGMFHQVRVPAKDKDLLRFFGGLKGTLLRKWRSTEWLFTYLVPHPPQVVQYTLYKAVQKDNSAHHRSEAIQTVLRNFYVDDCLTSVATEQQGIALNAWIKGGVCIRRI